MLHKLTLLTLYIYWCITEIRKECHKTYPISAICGGGPVNVATLIPATCATPLEPTTFIDAIFACCGIAPATRTVEYAVWDIGEGACCGGGGCC